MINDELLKFIEESPDSYHVTKNMEYEYEAAGYKRLCENEEWKIEKGGKYFVSRNGSSIIAFTIPERDKAKGFHIVATHSDSPSFKIKENPEITVEGRYVKLNTEKYGGGIFSSWMDRPLSVAGRIAVVKNDKIETKLVNIDRDLLVIPNLAIHMNRDVNKGVELNAQIDMLPLFSAKEGEEEITLLGLIAEEMGIDKEDICGDDLFLYVRDKGRIIGAKGEYILSPRLDDLQCAFSSMKAIINSNAASYVNVSAVFDNEEVGSSTKQGADSTFLDDTLDRIMDKLGQSREGKAIMLADSFLISADNSHGVHPNHPEKTDPTNRPFLNGGIVIKHSAAQKYTTDAVSAGNIRRLCDKAGVPHQNFTDKSDMNGGSTLGHISSSHISIDSADIGLAQLAMHSAQETAGAKDTEYAVKMFEVFFSE